MVNKLQGGGKSLASYILMQRILPPVLTCTMVRQGKSSEEDAVSELGMYGTYLRVADKVQINECVGHLLRTKAATSNEGGVAAGFAVLDSLYFEA
jgi:glutathione synthase